MTKEKELCITKRLGEIWQCVKNFWIKKNDTPRWLLAARKADTIPLQLYGYFWKKNFLILTDAKTSSHYLREIQLNFINVTITDWSNGIYIFYNCHIYRDWVCTVDGKGVPLYYCFNFVDRTIARICRPVLNKRAHHTKVHGIEFQSAVLPNGLIITLKGNGKSDDMTVYYRVY